MAEEKRLTGPQGSEGRPAQVGMDRAAIAAALLALLMTPLLALLVADRAQLVAVGIVGVGSGLFLLAWPQYAVHLLVAGTIFNPFFVDAGFALLGAGDLSVIVLIPVWVVRRLLYPVRLRLPRGWPLLLAYLAVAAASLELGSDPTAGRTGYLRELTYVAALLAGVDLTRDLGRLPALFRVLMVCGVVLAVHAFATWPGGGRMVGMIGQPNGLAFILAFCLWPTLGLAMSNPNRLIRLALFAAFGLMVMAVIMTISRSNYLGLAGAGLWTVRHYRRVVVIAALVAGGVGGILVLNPDMTADISRRWELNDRSVSQRLIERDNATRTILHSPWLGVGFGQFEKIHNEVEVTSEQGRSAHNQYLALPAEVGIPGALLLFSFVFIQLMGLWGRGGLLNTLLPKERWIAATLQALAVHQAITLAFRNAWRQPEWTVLFFYCVFVAILTARKAQEAKTTAAEAPASTT